MVNGLFYNPFFYPFYCTILQKKKQQKRLIFPYFFYKKLRNFRYFSKEILYVNNLFIFL